MIALKVSNEILDLETDFKITINLMSPMFTDQGSYSYPFKVPATSKNRRILDYRHEIAFVSDQWREFPCQVYSNGIILFNGLLRCRTASDDSYEGSIYADSGDFYYKYKDLYLQNIDFGGMTFETEQDAIDYFNGSAGLYYPDRDFALPYLFNDLFLDPPAGENTMMNFNCPIILDPETGEVSLATQNENGSRRLLVPCLFLKYVLRRMFQQLGYTLFDNFFTSDDYNRLVIYNSRNANIGPPWVTITDLHYNMHLPMISVTSFIKGLETFFGIGFFISRFSKTVYINSYSSIIKSSNVVDWSKNIQSVQVEVDEKITGYLLKMDPDPDDDKFTDLLADEQTALDILKGAVNKIADLPPWPIGMIQEVRWVIEEGNYYQMNSSKQWVIPNDWTLELFTQYLYKTATNTIESTFSTLTETDDEEWPRVQCGNKQENWKDITPRLFFVNLHPDRVYPTPYGQNHTDNISLWVPGENGLFEKNWKQILDWKLKCISVKITRQMDVVELKDFDFTKKYYMNGMKYLISDLQVTFGMKPGATATLRCQPCY